MTTTIEGLTALGSAARDLLGKPANLIGGTWEEGEADGTLRSLNPATEELLAEIPTASVEQTERAIAAARAAFDSGPWPRTSPRERSDMLLRLADLMDANREALVEIVVTEVGSPVLLSRGMQVGMPVENLRWAAEKAITGPPGGYQEALPPHFGTPPSSSLLCREPAGVVAGITGYNFPINSVVWKLGPALAAGCTIVIKPSERTSLSTLALIRLVEQAGFPEGAVNFVLGEADVGQVLSSHPDVDLTMFTGSYAVGRRIMQAASETTKRLVLELGGKSATIILPGADLDAVTGPSILRWTRNAGQGCGATTRTLVPRAQHDEFVERSRAFLDDGVHTGDPWDEKTDVGPLIREEQRAFVEGHVQRALEEGGTILAGGGRPDRQGFYVSPTIVGRVDNGATICREELFGPVGVILAYDSVDEAVQIANDSQYGLHAAVYGPMAESIQLARRLRTGAVSVNGGGFMHPRGPWGGLRASGFGREMGDDGYREFFEVKHIQWPLR
jgi:aldehyde dehydrogenase (NAD+)/betaine-aldehyde dehydrogenase